MNEKIVEEIYQMLKEKIMVVPKNVKIIEKNELVTYKADGIHLLGESDLYYPEERLLELYMPLSVTNENLKLYRGKPKQIVIGRKGDEKKYFRLEPVAVDKNYSALTYDEKNVYSQYIHLSNEKQVSVPLKLELRLPMINKNNVLSRDYTYKKVLMSLARECYMEGYDKGIKELKKTLKNRQKEEFVPNEEQLEVIHNNIKNFVKNIDAFEIGTTMKNPLVYSYVGCDGLKDGVSYEHYKVILYTIPEETKYQQRVKEKVFAKIEKERKEQKQEVGMDKQ